MRRLKNPGAWEMAAYSAVVFVIGVFIALVLVFLFLMLCVGIEILWDWLT